MSSAARARLAVALLISAAASAAEPAPHLSAAQSHYLEACGGCHGIEGISSPRDIPEIRGTVGRFLCSPAGREYIVRLPNVAFADIDDRTLAEVMNFMVFQLGGASVPADARPYTRAEVAQLRRRPLRTQSLEKLRIAILMEASARCASRGR